MNPNEVIIVWTTYPERKQAEEMAEALVDKRLAAGVNLIGPMFSVYRWRGVTQRHEEWLLLAQSTKSLFGELEKKLAASHPYETPCVMAFPCRQGYPPFLQWVETSCMGK